MARWLCSVSRAALAALACLPGLSGAPARAEAPARPPDVVLLTIDTLRADCLGSYGDSAIYTPYLDRLAKQGVQFEEAYCQVPLTLPSHTTMMTGVHPRIHGVTDNVSRKLAAGAETLAEVLGGHGYATGAVTSTVVLSPTFGINRGFAHFDVKPYPDGAAGAEDTVTRALSWLQELAPEAPFFLWVHFFDPHAAYFPVIPLDVLYRGDYRGSFDPVALGEALPGLRNSGRGFDAADLCYIRGLYAGEIVAVDRAIGRLCGELAKRGALGRTVLAVVADHGESFEHGYYFDHGDRLFEPEVRVPFLLWGSGVERQPHAMSFRAGLCDLKPTLLGLVGLKSAAAASGEDLSWLLRSGAAPAAQTPPSEARTLIGDSINRKFPRSIGDLEYVIKDQWKMIKNKTTGEMQLFDLSADPGEQHDRAADYPDLVAALSAALEGWTAPAPSTSMAESVQLERETEEALQALGYIQSEGSDAHQ